MFEQVVIEYISSDDWGSWSAVLKFTCRLKAGSFMNVPCATQGSTSAFSEAAHEHTNRYELSITNSEGMGRRRDFRLNAQCGFGLG